MNWKLFRSGALVAAVAALALGLTAPVQAQGGGADFTRVVGSQVVNGHWLVKLDDGKRTFIGDFTDTVVKRFEHGAWVVLTRQQARDAIVPGAKIAVKLGQPEGNGIIAILIGLLVGK
ncbi:MAG: hypothetical protein JST30_13145 [Armatimonadetes bacterium]|nr:hypothetical protein [Armatimonadota bacterium]